MRTPGAHNQGGNGSLTENENKMATLGRSLKSPSYLSRVRRPGMAPRALSSSSDVSVASAGSNRSEEQHMDFVMSGANTPILEPTQAEAMTSMPQQAQQKQHQSRAEPAGAAFSLKLGESSSPQVPKSSHSRPIAIELPQLRKYNSAPNCTPPEPLSARGDRPGGYFPLHEDPKARVHRFQPATKTSRQPHPTLHLPLDICTRPSEHGSSLPATMPEPVQLLRVDADKSTPSHTPVASYLPSGAHETSLPMGKYYPSNYEQTQRALPQASEDSSPTATMPSSIKSDSHIIALPSNSVQETDVKRRLQQYQRDMITQARLAATQVLGDGPPAIVSSPSTTVTLNGVPLSSLHHFGMTSAHKPISPRLLPLGSPGPVTPMDLEGGESGYLDRGRGPLMLGENEEITRALRAEVSFR